MMTLSTCFNWDTVQICNSETNPFHEITQEELATPNLQHLFSYSDENFFLSNVSFENYIDPTGGSLTHHNIFPTQEDTLLPSPKRQKCCYETSHYLDRFVAPYDNFHFLQGEELQQQICEFAQLDSNCVDLKCEKKEKERTISPQSVAARERRRKISDKTQQLGRLVPGGLKMNTAEMLHAAAKYVKYLQAQVEMLELKNSLEEDKAAPPSAMLHTLVVSPLVQEKLYAEEMCFVPKETVITLTNHEGVQSRPTMVEDLKQLIGTNLEKKEQV